MEVTPSQGGGWEERLNSVVNGNKRSKEPEQKKTLKVHKEFHGREPNLVSTRRRANDNMLGMSRREKSSLWIIQTGSRKRSRLP